MWWFIEPLLTTSVLIMLVLYLPVIFINCITGEQYGRLSKTIILVGAIPFTISFCLVIINILIYAFINIWKPYL